MKRILALALAALMSAASARAGTPKIEAAIAKDQDSRPTDAFAPDVPELYAFFRSTGTKAGDTLRAVWIADDVGTAAPKDTKINESTLTADKDNFFGAFSVSKPEKGWPLGKYRVDFYAGDQVATSINFTIKAGASEKDSDDDDDDDDEKADD